MRTIKSQARFVDAETPVHAYFYSMVELVVVRFFVQQGIFDAIPVDGISVPELAERVEVGSSLLDRFCNLLTAAGVLLSPEPGRISLAPDFSIFQEPRATLFYSHIFDSFMPAAVQWPEYFKVNGLTEPQRSTQSPFGLAAGHPTKSFYEVLSAIPGREKAFNATMALALADMPITGIYDFGTLVQHATASQELDRKLIVDVGGGKGQGLKAILQENPKIPARLCVLQDQSNVIQEVIDDDDEILRPVQKIAASFFDEPPTKGAAIYYIRRVLNDWPDEECVTILRHIRAACALDSKVLVSENLLPPHPSISLAAADIWMMNFGGKRRTEAMFRDIAARAGLRVASLSKHEASNSAVIEMVLL